MNSKLSLLRLVLLEFEEYWSFPVFELVLFAAFFSILNQPAVTMITGYSNLNKGIYGIGILLQILTVGLIVPRSFAGSFGRREIVVLLSYPVKRRSLLLSKIVANFLALLAMLSCAILVAVPLFGLSFFEAAPYALILTSSIQLLFLFSIAMFISVIVKNEIVSVFVFLLVMFGVEFNPLTTSGAFAYLTQIKSNDILYQYLTALFYNTSSAYGFDQFIFALSFTLLISFALITSAFVYYTYVMQVD